MSYIYTSQCVRDYTPDETRRFALNEKEFDRTLEKISDAMCIAVSCRHLINAHNLKKQSEMLVKRVEKDLEGILRTDFNSDFEELDRRGKIEYADLEAVSALCLCLERGRNLKIWSCVLTLTGWEEVGKRSMQICMR